MKPKRFISLALLILLMLAAFAPPSFANGAAHPGRMVDGADLLDGAEENALCDQLDRISLQYGCDVVIVTAPTLNGLSAEEYADDYYDYNHYGLGSVKSGILMLVCPGSRDYWFSTCGDAITMFSDRMIDHMCDEIVGYLSDGSYNEAFEKYIELCETALSAYVGEGKIYSPPRRLSAVHILASVALGAAVAFIIMLVKKSGMRTIRTQPAADSYVRAGSMQLTDSRDTFLYSRVNRVRRQTESSSGSSTHTSSSGTSHGGGGGKF